jgi:hypothetical protein
MQAAQANDFHEPTGKVHQNIGPKGTSDFLNAVVTG